MKNPRFRVLIADDHSLVRMGMTSLLNCQSDFEVVGEAEDGRQTLELTAKTHPDVVIMDLFMPVMDGADTTAEIRARFPDTNVLVITSFGTSSEVVRAIRNGARGVYLKDAPNEDLLDAIRTVAAGGEAIAPDVRRLIAASNGAPVLSARQLKALEAAAKGLTTDQIADQLGISVDGVKKHFSAIFRKLNANSRSECVAIAIRQHLLHDPR